MDTDQFYRKSGFAGDHLAEELHELQSLYLDYLRGEVDTFRSLLVRRDLDGIREVGHRLKGSAGSYGFARISEIGEIIQCLEPPAEWSEVETLFHQLEEKYEQIAQRLLVGEAKGRESSKTRPREESDRRSF